MTPDDAQKLLAACAAFDNRQPSQIAKRAWARSLHDIPLDDDCFEAVARFYGTPPKEAGQRLWVQPHDVRTHRRILRAERLENFVYEPPPGDDDPDYIARLRSQQRDIGSGAAQGPVNAPALTGGPHPDVAKLLAGIGRDVPEGGDEGEAVSQVRRSGPLGIECPKCKSPVGRPCRTPGGKERAAHPARKGETSSPEAERAEMEKRRAASAATLRRLAEDNGEAAS